MASIVYYVFGVPRYVDKLNIYFKEDSKLFQKVLKESKLGSMQFMTCLAGTFSKCQMLTMLVVELVYHKLYTQVKLHREIFKFKDGGQAAMDWAFEMPQKTKYLSETQKVRMEKKIKESHLE